MFILGAFLWYKNAMINIGTVFKYRLKLYKAVGGESHNFISVLRNAVTQSGLAFVEKGNKARVYVYLGAGKEEESFAEIAEIFLTVYSGPEEIKTKLAPYFEGSGFVLKAVELIPYHLSNVQHLISHVCYKVKGVRGDVEKALSLCPKAERKFLYSIKRLSADEVEIIMKINPSGSFTPVQELLKLLRFDVRREDYKATRIALYWVDTKGALQEI